MPNSDGWISDDEMDAIGDGWSEIYRAQDLAEAEAQGKWICGCGAWNSLDANCACGEHSRLCDCEECQEIARSWLCVCGNYETGGCHCGYCGCEPPWGCDCGLHDDVELRDEDDSFMYEPELGYMPIEMPLGRHEWLAPWEDVYERDDSEGWEDEP